MAFEREKQLIVHYQTSNSDPMTHSENAVPRDPYIGFYVNGIQLSLGTGRNWAELTARNTKNFTIASRYPRAEMWARSWASHNELKFVPSDLLDSLCISAMWQDAVLLTAGPMNVVAILTDLAVPTPEDGSNVWEEKLNFWAITTQPIWELAPAYFIPMVIRCLERAIKNIITKSEGKPMDLQEITANGFEAWKASPDWEAFLACEFLNL